MLVQLYLAFLRIGGLTFGGGLTMLPMLKYELVEKNHWITEEELIDCYAVGQCTPGIIAINTATYVGFKKKGVLGGIFSTLGMVTPSLVIITILAASLSTILDNPYVKNKQNRFDAKHVYDFELEKTLDERVLLKELGSDLAKGNTRRIEVNVTNTDRTFGTILGSSITKIHGDNTLADDTFVVKCNGAGGQSFGAFIPKGLTLELEGDSNDYFGKGLSGGKLIVYPPKKAKFKHNENIIIGNVALYGATSGSAYINGIAGERFCVRNSGARAVVEGVGDHGLEYMTGGCVVILGNVGKNFAAGMSGGVAYVLDIDSELYTKVNKEMVSSEEITSKYDVFELKDMIKEHVANTNSLIGKEILDDFENYLPKFKKIIPHDYDKMLKTIVLMEEKGLSSEQAQIEAFYAIKG